MHLPPGATLATSDVDTPVGDCTVRDDDDCTVAAVEVALSVVVVVE